MIVPSGVIPEGIVDTEPGGSNVMKLPPPAGAPAAGHCPVACRHRMVRFIVAARAATPPGRRPRIFPADGTAHGPRMPAWASASADQKPIKAAQSGNKKNPGI